MLRSTGPLLFSLLALGSCSGESAAPQTPDIVGPSQPTTQSLQPDARETFLSNLKQLTFGGQNAEAYFSFDGAQLIFQASPEGAKCDQIFSMSAGGGAVRRVSTGTGRCTCAYFLPGDDKILFASTHLASPDCPPEPDRSQGYVWPIYPTYDIFTANADGSSLARLTDVPGYDAEATVSPDGKRIVFTSTRDGDLELYAMDLDGSNVVRLTHTPGYDGGAFYSPDSKKICWRAGRLANADATARYSQLLAQGLVEPRALELYVMDADGSNPKQVTKNGKANFCPFFTPDGKHLIFASNFQDPKGREFDLFMIAIDGGGDPVRITYTADFDGFPMFSPDGTKLVFASNRNGKQPHETNIFIADWKGPR